MSPSRSALSSYFETKGNCGSMPAPLSTIETVDPLSNSTAGQCVDGIDVALTDQKVPQHSRLVLNRRAIEDNDGLSPLGSSVESNSNETFDGDAMDSYQSSVTGAIDSDDASSDSHSPHGSEMATAEAARVSPLLSNHPLPLQRKSRLRQKVDRLKSKNSALQSTVNQMRSDLARERQMRSAIDEIYLKIKSDLNQRLENEELKNLNLTMEVEQMATEMKDLKDQLATHKASTSASSTATRCSSVTGYRIGYDNSSFSLSNGISNIEGLMLHSQSLTQSTLIDGQDDSEEFLLSHSYSSSVVQSTRSASALSAPTRTATSTFMSCSEDEDEDENMATDHSDDESDRDIKSLTFKLTQPCRSDSRGTSVSSAMPLPTLIEEEDAEEMEESDGEGEPYEEHDDAPRTMMEMIIQRQMAYTPEDDMENPPADADETFETMAQSLLYQAIPSRFTVAQMHMQLEDLMSKYGARLDQAVDVLAKELSRWWEIERLAVGGPAAGGWGSDTVVINKQTGERANPKAAVEKRVETFFGPLFLQFVATSSEQKLLLEKLEQYAQKDASWLRNHNAVLVALYKYDVVETEAILEWWRGLEAPRGIFGHGGNNLRSLNSKFVAWLEDEEDDSDSEDEEDEEDEDYESDSESDEEDDSGDDDDDDDDDDDYDDEEEEDRDYSNDDAAKLEQVMVDRGEDSVSSDSNSRPASTASSLPTSPTSPTSLSKQTAQGEGSNSTEEEINGVVEPKRRISFCTNNNMYYSQDGTVCSEKNLSSEGTETSNGKNETEDKMSSKKYVQCPPFVALNEADNSGDNDENASASMDEGDEEGAKDTTADNSEE
ncbi:hypothetical protein BG011_004032 [Mortierella polycephala]|uniref:W2 domain-containing protein n=1 Tax=Mortierella polycephala TaxID=41804 RepID=A0A9P6PZE1_9FUNG|nr:hypothetical protein BG011_004032 [Mortierella polycephala]